MPKLRSTRPLGLRRVGQDESDVELAQRPVDDGLGSLDIALLQRDPGHRTGPLPEVAGLVGVEGHGASPAPQVVDGNLPVGGTVIAGAEAGHEQPVGGVIMHLDERESPRDPVLEPGVLGAIPLDQLAEGGPARSCLAVPRPLRLRLPDSVLDHPQPQRGGLHHPRCLGVPSQVFGQQGGSEVPVQRVPGSLQRPCTHLRRLRSVGRPTPQSVRHHRVTLFLPCTPQAPEVPGTHSDQLSPAARRDQALLHLVQHRQSISLPLAQRQHLLHRLESVRPYSANKIRKRTFLFQPNRTFLFQWYTRVSTPLWTPYLPDRLCSATT